MGRILGAICGAVFCLVLAGCGGGTTTIVETTVVTEGAEGPSTPTFLKAVAFEKLYVEPTLYPFSADGSLVGKQLTWEGWGSATATGRGKIEERDFSSGDFNDRPTYPGTVLARGLEECRGRNYYTEVVALVPPDAVFVPEKAAQLTTPCRSFEEIQQEEQAAEAEEARAEGPTEGRSSFFYTPSHNIACAISPESIRCDIKNKSWTPPPKPGDCNLDWGNSVSVDATGGPTILCAGDSLFGGHYMELPYGEIIARGEISCLSRKDGLICVNEEEEGFLLSYQRISLF